MPQKYMGEAEIQLHSFLTSALGGDEQPTLHPTTFAPMKEPWYPWIGRLGGPQSH
jgi:hypothetical protein